MRQHVNDSGCVNRHSRTCNQRRFSLPILSRTSSPAILTYRSADDRHDLPLEKTKVEFQRAQHDTNNHITLIRPQNASIVEPPSAPPARQRRSGSEKQLAERAAAEKAAAEKAAARQKSYRKFKGRITTVMARATRPKCPHESEETEIESMDQYRLRFRAASSPASTLPWETHRFDRVFDTTSTNADILEEVDPIVCELRNPQEHTVCIGVDGFSGGGKSFTSYTQDTSILSQIGKLLLSPPNPDSRIVFEAMQTPGVQVDSLDLPNSTIRKSSLKRLDTPPLKLKLNSLFQQHRPCYEVTDLESFELLVRETIKFRTEARTTNNATSSRTHLAIVLYIITQKHTSVFCLFDLAGNERSDALLSSSSQSKMEAGSTNAVNSSRLNVHTTLRHAILGQEWVSNGTAVSLMH
jgi:hypothetical protein